MERQGSTEYLILRQTIAARGSLKGAAMLFGMGAWAGVLTATLLWLPYPAATLIPLLVLLATFEVVKPLHVGAERIGRYLQVFYEEDGQAGRPLADTPSWERVAMRISVVPGAGGHPLFVPVFFLATLANLSPLLLVQPPALAIETATLLVPHGAFVIWQLAADRAMRAQRVAELAQFRELRKQT